MNPYKETFETWDKVAKLYEDKFMQLDLYNDTYDKFCELIPKSNPSIFEIGCGPGNITKYLIGKRPDFKIDAIDISQNMLALAKINNPTAHFSNMDSREIHQIEKQFDGIISGFCLPYLSEFDISKLLKDASNLLNENGIIYLSFVDSDQSESGYLTGSTGDRTYFYYHTVNFLKNELLANEFEMIDLVYKNLMKANGTEESNTIIIAKKRTSIV